MEPRKIIDCGIVLICSTLPITIWYAVDYFRQTFSALPQNSYIDYALALFIVIAVLFGYRVLHKKQVGSSAFVLSKSYVKTTVAFLGLLFPIALLGRLIDPGFDVWYISQNNLVTLTAIAWFLPLIALAVVFEELIERLLLQSNLTQYFGSMLTIVAISVQFAIYHYIGRDNGFHAAMMVVFVFLGSIVIASLFETTKSVTTTVLLHMCSNTLVVFQMYLHATKNYTLEFLLWGGWAVLFVLFFEESITWFKHITKQSIPALSWKEWIFLMVFSLALPLLIVFA